MELNDLFKKMESTVYILFSKSLSRYYVGYTSNSIETRIERHLSNHRGYSSKAKDWELVYHTSTISKQEALKLEKRIKKRGAKRFLDDILNP